MLEDTLVTKNTSWPIKRRQRDIDLQQKKKDQDHIGNSLSSIHEEEEEEGHVPSFNKIKGRKQQNVTLHCHVIMQSM